MDRRERDRCACGPDSSQSKERWLGMTIVRALTIPAMWAKMISVLPSIPTCRRFNRGPVAQLGARFHGMEEVVGSIPTRSTNLKHLQRYAFPAQVAVGSKPPLTASIFHGVTLFQLDVENVLTACTSWKRSSVRSRLRAPS